MLHRIALTAAAALLAVSLTVPTAVRADGSEVTLTGEIVDLSCYLPGGKKGRAHRACAKRCAERGLPLGILTDDGKVYLLMEDHADEGPYEKAKKLAGDNAEIKGKKYESRGMASILVHAVESR